MPEIIKLKVVKLHQVVKAYLQNGITEEEIINLLQKENIDAFYAQTIIDNVLSDKEDKKDFWKLLLAGLFTIAAGLLINYFSYAIAYNTGSLSFYLFWGIIVAGIMMISRAFILFKK